MIDVTEEERKGAAAPGSELRSGRIESLAIDSDRVARMSEALKLL